MKEAGSADVDRLGGGDMPAKQYFVEKWQNNHKADAKPTLGQLMQNYREEAGISLRQFARQLGISIAMASLMERDKVFPSHAILEKLANFLKADAKALKRLDTRLRMDHLRRVIEKSPELSEALRLMLDRVRQGHATAEMFAAALVAAARKH